MMEVIQVTKTFAVKGDAETGGVLACPLGAGRNFYL